MKSRLKQNKNKLKFKYIENLQGLGFILKKNSSLYIKKDFDTNKKYNEKIISNFSKEDKYNFIELINDCDQILPFLRKIDSSLVKSHNIFKSYLSLMDK